MRTRRLLLLTLLTLVYTTLAAALAGALPGIATQPLRHSPPPRAATATAYAPLPLLDLERYWPLVAITLALGAYGLVRLINDIKGPR